MGDTAERAPVFLADEAYFQRLLDSISGAREEILLVSYVFKVNPRNPRNHPYQVLKELGRAAKRGTRVSVVLEASEGNDPLNEDNRRTAKLLRKKGIAVRFDDPSTTTHAKVVVIDGRYVFIGSHNLTDRAMAGNHETSVLIESESMASQIKRYIEGIR